MTQNSSPPTLPANRREFEIDAQGPGDGDECAVAGCVSLRVIDLLEVVKVDEEHHRPQRLLPRDVHRGLRCFEEAAAIQQTCQLVFRRQVAKHLSLFLEKSRLALPPDPPHPCGR